MGGAQQREVCMQALVRRLSVLLVVGVLIFPTTLAEAPKRSQLPFADR